jgi:predicted RNase H-like nuclease (RuvC/YqgF family)
MAKQKSGNYVALEIEALKKKVAEFRKYLEENNVRNIQEYSERHDEIKIQVLLMKELINIVAQLDNLEKQSAKELEDKQQETRGDVPLSPLEEGLI